MEVCSMHTLNLLFLVVILPGLQDVTLLFSTMVITIDFDKELRLCELCGHRTLVHHILKFLLEIILLGQSHKPSK
jgi:hypothetical protein